MSVGALVTLWWQGAVALIALTCGVRLVFDTSVRIARRAAVQRVRRDTSLDAYDAALLAGQSASTAHDGPRAAAHPTGHHARVARLEALDEWADRVLYAGIVLPTAWLSLGAMAVIVYGSWGDIGAMSGSLWIGLLTTAACLTVLGGFHIRLWPQPNGRWRQDIQDHAKATLAAGGPRPNAVFPAQLPTPD